MEFYSLKVSNLTRTTPECTVVSLDVPEELSGKFTFKAGQYLTLKADIKGEEVRRSYSLCSCPDDQQWKVGVKEIPGGKFSGYVNNDLKIGDELMVAPPDGRFCISEESSSPKNYLAIAAGSGITPIISIISTILRREPESTLTLFYVNQTVSSIILKEELEALKNNFIDRLEVFHFLTREERDAPLFNGRLDQEKLNTLFKTICDPDEIDDYFICGPEPMIFMIRDFLLDLGIDAHNVHFELFNTGGSGAHGSRKLEKEYKGKVSAVTVREGGKRFTFKMAQGLDNLLDAAIAQSADLPFACKGGVCCTCKAKLEEGNVEMLKNFGLEEDEVASGYILTCQALPISEKVVIDFDS